MPTPTYRARATAILSVTAIGSSAQKKAAATSDDLFDIPLRCQSVAWEREDHNRADRVAISAEWYDAGMDPRALANAAIKVYIGQANDRDLFTPTDDNERFRGIVTEVKRASSADGRLTVELVAHDLTSLFLRTKPFRENGVPSLSMTLSDAWRLICDYTGWYDHQGKTFISTATALKDHLVFRGAAKDVQLSKSAAPRFANLAKVMPAGMGAGETDAWAVWKQCVGMVGFLTYIDRGDCIVTTATDFYSSKNPVRFIYGQNVLEHEESRDCTRTRVGIGLISFDPISGKTIETFWPPLTYKPIKGKFATSGVKGVSDVSKYEIFPAPPGVTNEDDLLDANKYAWEEISRQELRGGVTTTYMELPRFDGSMVDIMSVMPGDAVSVEFDAGLKSEILKQQSQGDRIIYLVSNGYSQATAQLMAANVDDLTKLKSECSVVRVGVAFEASDEGGKFEVNVGYNARLQDTGDTDQTAT
jgi:hypothetical protein